MAYEVVIGLEVHVELDTHSKIFCGCSTRFGASPNTQCCPVCLGLPGALPVLNRSVVEYAIMAGLALNCEITRFGYQDRKHYFYPDLSKAFQISQNDKPLAAHGKVVFSVEGTQKTIGITRIHIEEDAGKLIHDASGTMIDYNRAGVPLIEIVSEPDFRSAAEVKVYLQKLQAIVIFLGISSGKMNEGALRCDVNLSVRKKGDAVLGTRTETKNMNTFSAIVKAIEHETQRQIAILESGGVITQETRRWDNDKNTSHAMRSKEDAHDYRYFPDPDLGKIVIDDTWLKAIEMHLNKLPDQYKREIKAAYGITDALCETLVMSKQAVELFIETAKEVKDPELLGQFIITEVFRKSNVEGAIKIEASQLVSIVELMSQGDIHLGIAKKALDGVWGTSLQVSAYISANDLWPIKDIAELKRIAKEVLTSHPQILNDFRKGKTKALGAYMGQMMKVTQGKADPEVTEQVFYEFIL